MSAAAWEAFADDAETLARLHDRELDTATIAALREVGFPANLALLPRTAEAQDAWKTMGAALDYYIPTSPAQADLDALAVEYAAIYLTGAYGASPTESVWLDQDHIACQQPMFELREIYRAAGLAAADWRKRPDDHLVLQLQYIAHMARRAASAEFSGEGLARMLDDHLLRWLPDFASRIAARTAHPFYAALAHLTVVWCRSFRDLLADTPR
ncbi:MAG: molecular chaperone TorD family protein [Gammaproteobacteria bacterium]|nr:molecular chaperone TorD family protein [Gammaproteobacteria bacterium]MBU1646063.1 molecular chaperone TorD family protein [Gammaproteobacteria bacterium]MBU1972125.1 molecular chaperone TorD family protein [Gammaproteobacteria bacterium]